MVFVSRGLIEIKIRGWLLLSKCGCGQDALLCYVDDGCILAVEGLLTSYAVRVMEEVRFRVSPG